MDFLSYTRFGQIKLVLTWKHHHDCLALTALEGSTHTARGEKQSTFTQLGATGPAVTIGVA